MYWLRWHYHVKDIAGAPYKIKKKERKEKKNKTTESPTVSIVASRQQLYCMQYNHDRLIIVERQKKHNSMK